MKKTIYLALVLLLAGCDTYSQDAYRPEYIVESYLIAGEQLPIIKLSETAPIDAVYNFDKYAVEGAAVQITLYDDEGRTEEIYQYSAEGKGYYSPVNNASSVIPGRKYALQIEIPGHTEIIRASTLIPGIFSIEQPVSDTLVYQNEAALILRASPSIYPGRPAVYMNKLQAIDTTFALTPFYNDLWEEDLVSKDELVENSSGITNEANFEILPDGMLAVEVPWVGVAFLGPNDIVMDAIDDNIFDFLRSREDNGTRPLGERENLVDHIEGGRGIFGSFARARVRVFVTSD